LARGLQEWWDRFGLHLFGTQLLRVSLSDERTARRYCNSSGFFEQHRQSTAMAIMKTKSLQNADSALMLSYAAGESEGFELLYKRHKSSVFRFFYFGTNGNMELASELFQDVWMTVVRGRSRFNVEMRFSDWLHHVAWARLYDHIRLHPTQPGIQTGEKPEKLHNIADLTSNVVSLPDRKGKSGSGSEEVELLNRLEGMPEDHREIVLLRYCFRMEFADIAAFLDIARSSVTRLHKEALAALRDNVPEAC